MVGVPSQRSGSGSGSLPEGGCGCGTLPEVRKWSRDLPGVPEVVGRPSRRFVSGRGPSRRSGNGRVPSRRSRIGRGTILEVRKWSGDAPGGPKVVEGPSWRSVSGRGPFQRSGNGRGTLP